MCVLACRLPSLILTLVARKDLIIGVFRGSLKRVMIIECMTSINEQVQFSSHGDENVIRMSNDVWTWCYISNGE